MSFLDWSVEGRPLAGETVSGDSYLVAVDEKRALLVVTDGLGHGPEAARVSEIALAVVEKNVDRDLPELVAICDEALLGTRGVVMTCARIDRATSTVTWLAVGNVSGALLRAESGSWEEVFQLGGIVGSGRLQTRAPETLPIGVGDYLIFATDGLKPGYLSRVSLSAPAEELARSVLFGYIKGDDDALVAVARYLGGV